jgi:hypothetical protein
MSNRFNEIYELIKALEGDFQKFYEKDNQAAGTRIRKGMQDLKIIAQNIRAQVQEMKNSRAEVESKKEEPAKVAATAPKAEAKKPAAAPKAEAKKKK